MYSNIFIYKHKAQPWEPKWHQHMQIYSKLEEHLIKLANNHIHTWKRFIDDIFIIWTGTITEFEQYMHTTNQIHQTIKFTHEISNSELTFLDVTLYKGDRFLHTNILDLKTHIKDTNNCMFTKTHTTPTPQP